MKKSIRELRRILDKDTYGGMFLDEDQKKVHLNVVDTTNVDLLDAYDDVAIHKVRYSISELNHVKEDLVQHMRELNIQSVGIDEKNNVVHVDMYKPTKDAIAKLKSFVNDDKCLNIEETFEELSLQNNSDTMDYSDIISRTDTTIKMAPGSRIYVENRGYCTVSANVRWGNGSSRKYGFLTCGHGIYPEDKVYYNDQYIGKIEDATCNSDYDCGIIEQASPYIYVNGPARNGIMFSYVGGYPENGEDVWFSGGVSASLTGKCTINNVTAVVGNIEMNGLIRTNCPTQAGDSGGMLFIKNDNDEYTFTAALVGGNSVNMSYFRPYMTTRNYYTDMYGYFSV